MIAKNRVSRQQQFRRAADAGDLRAQVHVARAEAVDLLSVGGLHSEEEFRSVAALAGAFPKHDIDTWSDQCRHLKAAYALGIAIGQLVHPDVFKSGATR